MAFCQKLHIDPDAIDEGSCETEWSFFANTQMTLYALSGSINELLYIEIKTRTILAAINKGVDQSLQRHMLICAVLTHGNL